MISASLRSSTKSRRCACAKARLKGVGDWGGGATPSRIMFINQTNQRALLSDTWLNQWTPVINEPTARQLWQIMALPTLWNTCKYFLWGWNCPLAPYRHILWEDKLKRLNLVVPNAAPILALSQALGMWICLIRDLMGRSPFLSFFFLITGPHGSLSCLWLVRGQCCMAQVIVPCCQRLPGPAGSQTVWVSNILLSLSRRLNSVWRENI